jgi:hypothetical protein
VLVSSVKMLLQLNAAVRAAAFRVMVICLPSGEKRAAITLRSAGTHTPPTSTGTIPVSSLHTSRTPALLAWQTSPPLHVLGKKGSHTTTWLLAVCSLLFAWALSQNLMQDPSCLQASKPALHVHAEVVLAWSQMLPLPQTLSDSQRPGGRPAEERT